MKNEVVDFIAKFMPQICQKVKDKKKHLAGEVGIYYNGIHK
jgi:hypothetical protein